MNLGDKASLKREKQDISITRSRSDDSGDPSSASSVKLEPAYGTPILSRAAYIRLRVHAISRSCPHLHAAVIIRPGLRDTMRYTGPLFGPGCGENRARDRPLYPPPSAQPPVVSFPFLSSAPVRAPINAYSITPTKSVVIVSQLERWWSFILIHAGDPER